NVRRVAGTVPPAQATPEDKEKITQSADAARAAAPEARRRSVTSGDAATIHPSLCISGLSGRPSGHARPASDHTFAQTVSIVRRIVWGHAVQKFRTCRTFAERSARRYADSPQKWFSQNGQI